MVRQHIRFPFLHRLAHFREVAMKVIDFLHLSQGGDVVDQSLGDSYRGLRNSSAGTHGFGAPRRPANLPPVQGFGPAPGNETRDRAMGESPPAYYSGLF